MFLGAATYFAYGFLRPTWDNAVGQLAGFLAYDIVLIVPFLSRLSAIEDRFRIGLIAYLAVVLYSAALAGWYLLIDRRWSIVGRRGASTEAVPGPSGH
jgi:hypothetical protein